MPQKRISVAVLCASLALFGAGCFQNQTGTPGPTDTTSVPNANGSASMPGPDLSFKQDTTTLEEAMAYSTASSTFGGSVEYVAPTSTISPAIAADFKTANIAGLKEMQKAYGVTFSAGDLALLQQNKFVVKPITDTSIAPWDEREFSGIYRALSGGDVHTRDLSNAVFYSSDVFLNEYHNLYLELLKEMENKTFYPNVKDISKAFFVSAGEHLKQATSTQDIQTWTKVQEYFAVPYALLSTVQEAPTPEDYMRRDPRGGYFDPSQVDATYAAEDAKADSYDNAATFVHTLGLDASTTAVVLHDVKLVFDATCGVPPCTPPQVFEKEYKDYDEQVQSQFSIDWTQFEPRGAYTDTSVRREYFRALKWYIMVPYFLRSQDLTYDAFAVTQLMAEHPTQLKEYSQLEQAINFMVGSSDDLMPVDYIQAIGTSDPIAYLVNAHNPQIKDVIVQNGIYDEKDTEAKTLDTKGMRFFSGKYIIDAYWMGQLSQGDEPPKPGYPAKLPPRATSLEVMNLLGSDYAKSQLSKFDFYTPKYAAAIDKALADLNAENAKMTAGDWMKNVYTSWLWTIKSLFSWTQEHQKQLPRFMQGIAWAAKTLQTASASWTELRHDTILYAKQPFSGAEMGGGGAPCDLRAIPEPPKGYIEPNPELYARLSYLAKRTEAGLQEQGFALNNMPQLQAYIDLMDTVQAYTNKELANAKLQEKITASVCDHTDWNPGDKGTRYSIESGDSDWEALRALTGSISAAEPGTPDAVSTKDKRAAIVADVMAGGDKNNPTQIVYEGEGVPYIVFTAVSDVNGKRLTVGAISSQYEFSELFGGPRKTDEEWQKNFYQGTDVPFAYTSSTSWPAVNPWYAPIFGGAR